MYKIIEGNKVIDVVDCADFIRFLPTGGAVRTSKDLAQGIIGSDYDTIYSFIPIIGQNIKLVTAEEITLEEFNRLRSLLNSNQEIPANKDTLIKAKQIALECLSNECKNRITMGFSIKLSDNKIYNFKLTAEDQLNLLSIENQLNSGGKTFLYHASNEPCKFFTRKDMLKIINMFKKHVLYHTTYFNIAKQYINTLIDIDKINQFVYGVDVSGQADNKVIKQILKSGDGNK